MILAGEAVGELGRRLAVPLPYRGQAEPVLPEQEELDAVPPGPCQAVLLRQRMTRSITATVAPVRHAGLGLDAYVQFTSPIRRWGTRPGMGTLSRGVGSSGLGAAPGRGWQCGWLWAHPCVAPRLPCCAQGPHVRATALAVPAACCKPAHHGAPAVLRH